MTKLGTALNAVTTGVAVAAYAQWQREQRRRPEAKVDWWWSATEHDIGYQEWPHGEVPTAGPVTDSRGNVLWVRLAATNVGDAVGYPVHNFLASAIPGMSVERWNFDDREYVSAREGIENERIGLPPERSVRWFVAEREWPPGLTWVQIYRLTLPKGASGELTLGLDLGEPRLDATGPRRQPLTVEAKAGGRFDLRRLSISGSKGETDAIQ